MIIGVKKPNTRPTTSNETWSHSTKSSNTQSRNGQLSNNAYPSENKKNQSTLWSCGQNLSPPRNWTSPLKSNFTHCRFSSQKMSQ